jgi:hypothetical protein
MTNNAPVRSSTLRDGWRDGDERSKSDWLARHAAIHQAIARNAANFPGVLTTVVGSLPTPAGLTRAFVTDSTVAAAGNFGAIVAGGGANTVPTYFDGLNWRIG